MLSVAFPFFITAFAYQDGLVVGFLAGGLLKADLLEFGLLKRRRFWLFGLGRLDGLGRHRAGEFAFGGCLLALADRKLRVFVFVVLGDGDPIQDSLTLFLASPLLHLDLIIEHRVLGPRIIAAANRPVVAVGLGRASTETRKVELAIYVNRVFLHG